ncbi:S41 family peptidase [Ligilactobacillus equi]|uniref:Carboxy-terminal processing protease n=1 Tax=Ligilactobacillus equi DSM 15833 = JCM 10991 TaxID=1423740 RepID=A0A0R1T7R9_9LACO|nr:S41 family peptidase [Ligilactobacillus equi]KRL77597.1 carboxy-terminal processing protease [Ligilactobacillus equi DSM 15833 = JCM 10991]
MAAKPQKIKRSYQLKHLILTGILGLLLGGGLMFGLVRHQLQVANDAYRSLGKVATVYQTLYYNYYKKVPSSKLEQGAIDGMIESLDDQFTEYLNKAETESLNNTIDSSFSGIGAQVQKAGEYIKISSAITGTPAQKAGLKTDDILLKVNGKSVKGQALDKVVTKIRGKIGTKVTVTIKRGDQVFNKTLTRAKIPIHTVNAKLIKKDGHKVGYLEVTTFSTNTTKEFKTAIKKLRKQGVSAFVVDMRNNPGGLMDQALSMSSMFLKNGQKIMRVKDRSGKVETYTAGKKFDKGFKVTEPTVILVNGNSASAAEIFSAALNESGHIKLIGAKTYGKGTVQTTQEFKNGTELKLTIAKWLTANGTWIHKKGIEPDIKADYPEVAYLAFIDTTKIYKEGQVSKQVKTLQMFLKYLGYFNGKANGYYGQDTNAAVQKFQSENGLDVNGQATKATVTKIEEKVSQKLGDTDPAYDEALKTVVQE